MIKFYSIIIIGLLFLGCSGNSNEKTVTKKEQSEHKPVVTKTESKEVAQKESVEDQIVIERYFPSEKEITEFDTIIASSSISIKIINRYLDSFVVNEFEAEEAKHIDKYRDSEKQIIIKYLNQTLVDTVFRKDDFIALTGPEFLEIADFHNYWFRELRNDTIEFFGIINKPETDWGIPFYHFFDIESQTFTVKEYIEEDI
ncbi:hypothetical protein LVD15_00175 [Fulvivirga maritima]|uniref:hypothetical protein n=1 Tax=Fulvivirga maritima TaxID=2904247 RepID=UPI001F2B2C36|nr:hypothetical protein [Fulvivirga maritima]UII26887.1 hypothetical protein LVD15_00175 [Fulvivirga maritima]